MHFSKGPAESPPETSDTNPLQMLSPEAVQAHRPDDSIHWPAGQRRPIPEAEAGHRRGGHLRGPRTPSPSPSRGGLQGWMPTARALSTRSVDGQSPSCEIVKIKPAWKAHLTPPLSGIPGRFVVNEVDTFSSRQPGASLVADANRGCELGLTNDLFVVVPLPRRNH